MEEAAHSGHQEQSSSHDVASSESSTSHASPSQQVEAEPREVHAEEDGRHYVQSTSEQRHNYYWQPTYIFQRFSFGVCVPCFGSASEDVRNDVLTCAVVVLTFWFFASMILILGFYGSYNLQLGPNCSYAVDANPFFVHSIKAQLDGDQTEGLMLYGFHKSPLLNVEKKWSQDHTASVEPDYHTEWTYHLNAGSRIAVSYDVKHPSSDPLSLIIAQGRESLVEWIDDPSYPNTTLSWNIVYGSGRITQDIKESDTYYVAVGNLNMESVQVYLNITVWSLLYNTTDASFKCSLSDHLCTFKLILLKPNVAVLTTPDARKVDVDNGWYIQVSFGPQWLTYCCGSCLVTALVLAMSRYCNRCQSNRGYEAGNQSRGNAAREPLLSPKSDDSSSVGSSYDSASNDEDDLEENTEGSLEGRAPKEGESNSSNTSRLCAICFDAPKDCFFVPCGHSAACFSCGSRIAEEAGTCPICRRRMKKVRKIFSV